MFGNVKFINRLAFLIAAAAVFILAISFIYYAGNNWFRIDRIIVRGNISNITSAEVANMVKTKLKGTFFTLNIGIIQKGFEQIPWVKNVHVTREFPDTINVDVVEYKAIANLGNGKLLSEERLVFNGTDTESELPLFTVPVSQINNALTAYSVLKPFMILHQLKLKSLAYNGVGLTKLGFANGLTVVICDNSIANELQVLDKYWVQLHQIDLNMTSVNMCYKDALAIS